MAELKWQAEHTVQRRGILQSVPLASQYRHCAYNNAIQLETHYTYLVLHNKRTILTSYLHCMA